MQMSSAGGFVPPGSNIGASSSTDSNARHDVTGSADVLLSLTPRQETRLRSHLDERLLNLERDERKRALGPLLALVPRLRTLLRLILQIPPRDPWASLRVDYFLTLTGSISTYITALPLFPRHGGEERLQAAETTLRDLLSFLEEVEDGWLAVLRGDAWVVDSDQEGRGHAVKVRYTPLVGQTERTRLRSIVMASREKMLAWARMYGDFPGSALPGEPDDPVPSARLRAGDWETEIIGMWNGILDVLSGDMVREGQSGEADEDLADPP